MWAFGFLLLELLHGQMPACHKEFQTHPDYQAALQLGPSMDPRDVPGLKRHLVYLVGLSHDFDYASKVMPPPAWHQHLFSSALEQTCATLQSCRSDKRHECDCCSFDVCLTAVSALQVKYQPLPVNNAQEQQAVDVMKGLAAQYLQVGQLTPTSLVHTV